MDRLHPFHTLAGADVDENALNAISPGVFAELLKDRTTGQNIIWATDAYAARGEGYGRTDNITIKSVTGSNSYVIVPRALKSRTEQQQRSREMAEVFTPSWICNKQNNLIDNAWFGRDGVFNTETDSPDGTHSWEPSTHKIEFPARKTWQDYVTDKRLEITCGEAPYIASRYDAVSGAWLPVGMRIGLLDRKLRVVGENTASSSQWIAAAKAALRSVYAYEWQGDNLLLARENIFCTVLDFYYARFGRRIPVQSLPGLAYIISWNIWQMDGLKGVIPETCGERRIVTADLFGETVTVCACRGCKDGDIKKHNGTYAMIVDWPRNVTTSRIRHGQPMRFIDLIK